MRRAIDGMFWSPSSPHDPRAIALCCRSPAAALASIQLLRAERLVRLPDQQPKGPDWLRLSLTKKPLLRLGNGIVAQQTWTDESRARYRRERGRLTSDLTNGEWLSVENADEAAGDTANSAWAVASGFLFRHHRRPLAFLPSAHAISDAVVKTRRADYDFDAG